MLEITFKIGIRSDALYIGVNFIVASSNKYYIYAVDPS